MEVRADLEQTEKVFGRTPLLATCSAGHYEMVKYLREAGANVKAADKTGATALHIAAQFGYTDICEELVDSDADINAVDQYGSTPLKVAIVYRHARCIDVLTKAGANLETSKRASAFDSLVKATGIGTTWRKQILAKGTKKVSQFVDAASRSFAPPPTPLQF